jgi:nucleoside-diphosphate-sugar epimerase
VVGELVGRGLRVRVVARHGVAGLPPEVGCVEADITEPDAARRALAGATVVYHAASAPYHRWPELLPLIMRGLIAGATDAGARIVYADNLYAYGPVDGPLTEDLPARATGPNGRVRAALAAELMEADASRTVRAAIGRASDYYGPWARLSTAGERLFLPAIGGTATQVLGDPDAPHTYTFLGDFARGLVTLGTHDDASGQVWHLPSAETLTTRDFIDLVYEAAGNPTRLRVMPSALLSLMALVSPMLKAVKEQQYQRERSWVVDHTKFTTAFGADAEVTPHRDAIAATIAWWRHEITAAAGAAETVGSRR